MSFMSQLCSLINLPKLCNHEHSAGVEYVFTVCSSVDLECTYLKNNNSNNGNKILKNSV